jgi:hypothetical protein
MSKKKIIKKVTKILQADYGSVPTLYFCDADGDQVQIKRYSDIRFALKSHNKQLQLLAAQNDSISSSSSSRHPLLRLNARMGDEDEDHTCMMSTLTLLSPRNKKDKGVRFSGASAATAVTMEGDIMLHDDKFHWQKGKQLLLYALQPSVVRLSCCLSIAYWYVLIY